MSNTLSHIVGQVKPRLLPLSPVMAAFEWLIECLPRRIVGVELKPHANVEVVDQSKGEFKASGNAPCFEMILKPNQIQGGWYYLEAALVRNNGNREASIRASLQCEDDVGFTIAIPTNLRGTVREVFYLPPNVTLLQWMPTVAPGYFSQSPFLLHKITALESAIRRISRVIFDYWRFRSALIFSGEKQNWRAIIGNLQFAYQQTASLRQKRVMNNDYPAYIAREAALLKTNLRTMKKEVGKLAFRPLMTLIMPVQSPTEKLFREAIDSVAGQIYPNWELFLTGDFDADVLTLSIAQEFQGKNLPVKIISAKTGTTLAAVFNAALEQAQGEFVAKIGQHDKIAPHALFLLAQEINKYPDAELLYTDDDSVDENNKRSAHCFKPDWNQDLFLSQNYIGDFAFYRRSRDLNLGGYRAGFECAEAYDLTLRYLKNVSPFKIRHIPRVLFHARTTIKSTQSTLAAHRSGKRALVANLEGNGIVVEDGLAACLYRIKYPIQTPAPLVSIIIPTRDKVDILSACITSIQQKTDYQNWEILVVDNQSSESATHAYFEKIQSDSRIKVIRYEKPFNYSAMNNFAVQYAKGEILALLNNDVEVISTEWLTEMVSHAMRPGIGAVGAKLLYSNGTIQHAGVILGIGGVAGHAHKFLNGEEQGYCHRANSIQNFSAVTGACLIVQKSCYQEVSGLNEADLKVAFNDIDLCLKLQEAGYRNVYTPYAVLYHHESISRGQNDTPEKHGEFIREALFMKNNWMQLLQHDPAYNPNLTLEFEDFTLGVKSC